MYRVEKENDIIGLKSDLWNDNYFSTATVLVAFLFCTCVLLVSSSCAQQTDELVLHHDNLPYLI